ncbi:Hypothetical protein R9X50_00745200 [Acrodontium crateriforme]|uniref:Uncharacterized protein n=1 Tax=Acrodontium crateriforme TaxID=150365 RepID=A0AAQ3RCR9_9PEZI|nr:Hypothetical protein R9X50_00745200 [Acrodontium crateriforme]
MPRPLPWLMETNDKKATSSRPHPSPKKRRRSSSLEDLVDEDLNAISAAVPLHHRNLRPPRTPSTSPPPAPPDVEFMKDGTEHDDGWIMVEDEFYATAQLFTKHIHHAEYVRLKKLAKGRGSGTLQNISRPTDGRTTQSFEQKLRREVSDKDKLVAVTLKRVAAQEDEGESDDDMLMDPQLTGLMAKSQRANDDLSALVKTKANTRAAAGFSQSPRKAGRETARSHFNRLAESRPLIKKDCAGEKEAEESEDTDSEDLDAIPSKVLKVQIKNKSSPMLQRIKSSVTESLDRHGATSSNHDNKTLRVRGDDGPSYRSTQISPTINKESHDRSPPSMDAPHHKRRSTFVSSSPIFDHAGESSMRRSTTAISSYLARKKAAREVKEQKGKQTAKELDDIPVWLD